MSTVDTSIYLVLHTVINSLLKNVLTKCVGQYFSKISFSNKVWFCPDIFSWFLCGQPLLIFVVLIFFSKESRFQKCLLFFYPRHNASLIPSSAKSHGWKISGRLSNLRIKSRPTMIVKNWPNKNLSRLQSRKKFRLIFERKKETFLIARPMARAACWKKNGQMVSLIDRSGW